MTAERRFVDSNVLVYAFDDQFPGKQEQAKKVMGAPHGELVLSVQVLGEFFRVVTRKIKHPLTPKQALHAAEGLSDLKVWPIHRNLVRAAMRRTIVSRLSYWDSLIVETAIEAEATTLLTEDLQHGQVFGGLRVLNPFRATG